MLFRSDARTGELRDWTTTDRQSGCNTTVRIEHGAFLRELQDLNEESANCVEDARPGQPVSSFLRLVCCDPLLAVLTGRAPSNSAAATVRQILDAGALEPLDRLVGQCATADEYEFAIPLDWYKQRDVATDRTWWATHLAKLLPKAFAPGSWPVPLGRYLISNWAGFAFQASQESPGIIDSHLLGPIGYLAFARCWERVQPAGGILMARSGLKHLTAGDFRHDLDVLLNVGSITGQCTCAWPSNCEALTTPNLKNWQTHTHRGAASRWLRFSGKSSTNGGPRARY